jgi:hypothetical protein
VKLFIDDVRECPAGWTLARTHDAALEALASRTVSHVSFDHDLGEERDGHDIATWLEETIYYDESFPVPVMSVHSDNGPGIAELRRCIEAIERRKRDM